MICSVTTKRSTGGWLANDEKGRAEPIVFPVHLDLLPGLLAAKVYFHDVDSPAGPIPCWTYVSDLRSQQPHVFLAQIHLALFHRREPSSASYLVACLRRSLYGPLTDERASSNL